MDPNTTAEMLRQIRSGKDIPPPEKLLNMNAAKACEQIPFSPYTIATNLMHAVFWQDLWLCRLKGERGRSFIEDWRVATTDEWSSIRSSFLQGLDEAIAIAESEPFAHKMPSDDIAVSTLIQIAVHDAYHLGQINLLKRQLRKA